MEGPVPPFGAFGGTGPSIRRGPRWAPVGASGAVGLVCDGGGATNRCVEVGVDTQRARELRESTHEWERFEGESAWKAAPFGAWSEAWSDRM